MMTSMVEDKILGDKFLNAFKKRILGSACQIKPRFSARSASLLQTSGGYLCNYIHLHIVILAMNGSKDLTSILEQAKNSEWREYGISLEVDGYCAKFKTKFMGELIIFNETVFWKDNNILIDKNMILSVKDISMGRFMTLNILEGSSSGMIDILRGIFNKGDQLLEREGNIAYDAIKLLEPTCVQKWLSLSTRSDYDRESSRKFLNHLIESKSKLNQNSSEFFDYIYESISQLRDAHDVGTVFGSFRLWGHHYNYQEGLNALKTQCRLKK